MLRLHNTDIAAAMLEHNGLVLALTPVRALPPPGWTRRHTGSPCCQPAQVKTKPILS